MNIGTAISLFDVIPIGSFLLTMLIDMSFAHRGSMDEEGAIVERRMEELKKAA